MDFAASSLLVVVVLAPLAGALVNGAVGSRLPRGLITLVACGAVFVAALAATRAVLALEGDAPLSITLYEWMPLADLQVDVALRLDHLSAVMILVVTWVGFLIHVYSASYMHDEPALARYFAYLNLFLFAMSVLVLADSLPLMFVGWEGVGLCSYLLIGFWYSDTDKASAGRKAFIVNRIGDFGMIVAMLVLVRAAGTLGFEPLAEAARAGRLTELVATGAALMLILGAAGKSAQIPLYVWLPDAMAGPTPVSALIHAATMVTAGVYLTARMGFLFALAPTAMAVLTIIGALTALLAATIATVQTDLKKVLAYSTVSQLGFMFIAAGVGAYAVAILHVVTHAFFKACLFLGAGSVIHGTHEQDVRQLGGLWRRLPWTFATFLAATLAIVGFPLTSGFVSKDAILWSVWDAGRGPHSATFAVLSQVVWVLGLCAATLTAFYMGRLLCLTFFSGAPRSEGARHAHESSPAMVGPLVILGLLSLGGGALAWPHVLGGHAWLTDVWLGATPGEAPLAEEIALMGAATAAALLGLGTALALYGRQVHPWTARLAAERPYSWLYKRLLGAWHVDAWYDAVLVRPLHWVSKAVLYEVVERRGIDALVNLVGWLGRSLGYAAQVFHSGNVQRYIAVFAVGLAVLLYGWLTPFDAARPAPEAPTAAALPSPLPPDMPIPRGMPAPAAAPAAEVP